VANNAQLYTITATVRASDRSVLTDRQPAVKFADGAPVSATEFTLTGEQWTATVRGSASGTFDGVLTADGVELLKVALVFDPLPGIVEELAPLPPSQNPLGPLAAGGIAGALAGLLGLVYLVRHGHIKLPLWLPKLTSIAARVRS